MNNFNSSKVIDDIDTIVKARNVNVTNAQNSMFNLEASSEAVKIQQVNTDAIKMFFNNVDVELQQITKKIEEQDSNQSIDYDKIWGDELSPQADSKVKVVEMQILGTNQLKDEPGKPKSGSTDESIKELMSMVDPRAN